VLANHASIENRSRPQATPLRPLVESRNAARCEERSRLVLKKVRRAVLKALSPWATARETGHGERHAHPRPRPRRAQRAVDRLLPSSHGHPSARDRIGKRSPTHSATGTFHSISYQLPAALPPADALGHGGPVGGKRPLAAASASRIPGVCAGGGRSRRIHIAGGEGNPEAGTAL